MRLIDANVLKEKLLKERDAIPLTTTERYGFGVEFPNHHGQSMRGGIKKALRCMEETPTIDAVPKGDMEIILHEVIKRSKPKWISVQDELPKKITNKVLVYCKNGYIGFGHYEKFRGIEEWYNLESGKLFREWDLEDCETYEVTHWMPLPEPPKEGDN